MTPFLQFRLWARQGPVGERIMSGLAGAIVVGLLAWAAVPGAEIGTDTVVASQAEIPGIDPLQPGVATPTGSTTGAAPTAVPGDAPSSTPSSPAAAGPGQTTAAGVAAPDRCAGVSATDQGVTATTITIAVGIVSIQGEVGNSLAGLPGPDVQRADFDAVIAAVNKAGGVACRKLVAKYYDVNPLDASGQHAACLRMVSDKVFTVLNVGGFNPVANRDCLPQNKIPLIDTVPLPRSEADRYRPYLFSYTAMWDRIFRNFVQAANERQWFKGAGKIGLLQKSCDPEFNTQIVEELRRVGIDRSRLESFNFGCPPGVVPPNQIQQAALQFKTASVTHVVDVASRTLTDFSKAAAQQQYRPKYGVPDGGIVATTQNPNNRPDPSVDGALAITPFAYGAENSGGTLGDATARCNKILTEAGLPPAEKQGVAMGGVVCSLVWMFQAAADHAPTLTRTNLMGGLNRAGKVDLSFPVGPADFTAPGTTSGGQAWRPISYNAGCGCWMLLDAAWRPAFA